MSHQTPSQKITQTAPPAEGTGCLGVVVRLVWLAAGNAALFFLAIAIAQRRRLSPLDLVFWAIVLGLIILRYIDITRLKGLTKDGDPASLHHWRRYVALLVLISAGLWGLAHGVAPLLGR